MTAMINGPELKPMCECGRGAVVARGKCRTCYQMARRRALGMTAWQEPAGMEESEVDPIRLGRELRRALECYAHACGVSARIYWRKEVEAIEARVKKLKAKEETRAANGEKRLPVAPETISDCSGVDSDTQSVETTAIASAVAGLMDRHAVTAEEGHRGEEDQECSNRRRRPSRRGRSGMQ